MDKYLCVNEGRIASLETNTDWIRENMTTLTDKLDKIDGKLDTVIQNKADKKEVSDLERKFNKVMWFFFITMIAILSFFVKYIFFK